MIVAFAVLFADQSPSVPTRRARLATAILGRPTYFTWCGRATSSKFAGLVGGADLQLREGTT